MSDDHQYEPEHPSAERALELLKVIAQPVRMKILRTLVLGKPMRVSDVAAAIEEPANSVSYHLRQLDRVGIAHTTEPPDAHDNRETWWVIDNWTGLSITPSQIRALPGGDAVLAALDQVELTDSASLFSIARAEAAETAGTPALRADGIMLLTTQEARDLVDAVDDLLQKAFSVSYRHRKDGDEGVGRYDYRVVVMPALDPASSDAAATHQPD